MKRLPLRPLIAVFTLVAIFPVSAWAYGAGGAGMMDGCWGRGGAFFSSLSMIIVPVLFIIAIVAIVRWLTGRGRCAHFSSSTPHDGRGASPMDILNERFAKGEIDAEEYKERKRILDA
ncbi:SHOCT domain-containing protein [Varunaivibrio sulfuroxidans]|uniref:Putative membrane protein n=1 Tax=Varunaivibrio sulfuroxidans TaxID=1773489 RepID=A0A4R3JAR2_9PROT|nr:SHOCT domain-containing protein [Varunaivibrio sulfuroxidans]TCS62958.1 putative membrane protein [Varunaivibrio sulfuroxidans]WES31964.1 SHOCT domain-containing protein [Varunaivibrio sulfuroxidans]